MSLLFRFGVKPNTENIVSFDHNDLLKGTEFLGELIESALNHQPLNLLYRTFAGKERYFCKNIVAPIREIPEVKNVIKEKN